MLNYFFQNMHHCFIINTGKATCNKLNKTSEQLVYRMTKVMIQCNFIHTFNITESTDNCTTIHHDLLLLTTVKLKQLWSQSVNCRLTITSFYTTNDKWRVFVWCQVVITSHHMEKMDADLSSRCIQEITVYDTNLSYIK